jgi:ribonucleoside-diphosphate reductase alpha chain
LKFPRIFTRDGVHPFDELTWELRDASITNEKGKVVFEQKGIEVPSTWSQAATNIVVSKYFRGNVGEPGRETSIKQLIGRVATTIADWGRAGGYFATPADALTFEHELAWILVTQRAAFNTPVWFNVGAEAHPQCSACFINSVEDSMRSILQLAVTEGMLFKGGSGTGSNLSTLRSSFENLGNSDGRSSGPVSFMKGYDAFAGVIKSGGRTRRAAKMVILNIDHPDIEEFINCKSHEEQKAWALIEAGYDSSFNGEAYRSVFFQNANHSVRVTDEFMQAVATGGDWTTHYVTTGKPAHTYKAQGLMHEIAEAAWISGDPGLQFHTTINRWHTCPNTGPINASNPCSEYMFLDDTACNLASLNLMLFRRKDGEFDVEAFKAASAVMITAMEIIVGNSSYPTEKITENSRRFRPLGIGYANLGALLMARGLPYDSDQARAYSGAITSLMSGWTYRQSAIIAGEVGAFDGFAVNREPMLRVMGMHRDASRKIANASSVPADLLAASQEAWDQAVEMGTRNGYRNSQISVLAPTGTIAFMMDCDTTGVEPDIALVKYKWLVGGGMMKIVNRTVPEALDHLGYNAEQKAAILKYIDERDTIEGAPELKEEHLPVFDCAFKAANGTRSIHYHGHIKMMGAVQPFISGAISKTVNMPTATTAEEIEQTYAEAWKLGLKAIAIYRDGCKRVQPLTMKKTDSSSEDVEKRAPTASLNAAPAPAEAQPAVAQPAAVVPQVAAAQLPGQSALPLGRSDTAHRRRMPEERRAITHKFSIGGHEGYLTVGLYDDGTPEKMNM